MGLYRICLIILKPYNIYVKLKNIWEIYLYSRVSSDVHARLGMKDLRVLTFTITK